MISFSEYRPPRKAPVPFAYDYPSGLVPRASALANTTLLAIVTPIRGREFIVHTFIRRKPRENTPFMTRQRNGRFFCRGRQTA
jgi:hypothetical protein